MPTSKGDWNADEITKNKQIIRNTIGSARFTRIGRCIFGFL